MLPMHWWLYPDPRNEFWFLPMLYTEITQESILAHITVYWVEHFHLKGLAKALKLRTSTVKYSKETCQNTYTKTPKYDLLRAGPKLIRSFNSFPTSRLYKEKATRRWMSKDYWVKNTLQRIVKVLHIRDFFPPLHATSSQMVPQKETFREFAYTIVFEKHKDWCLKRVQSEQLTREEWREGRVHWKWSTFLEFHGAWGVEFTLWAKWMCRGWPGELGNNVELSVPLRCYSGTQK